MSDNDGMFIDSKTWVAVRQSKRQQRKLTGRTEPYPGWIDGSAMVLSFVAIGVLMLFLGAHDSTMAMTLSMGILGVYFVASYLLNAPKRRDAYRTKLIRSGTLLTTDTPMGRMVLIAPVVKQWRINPHDRAAINRALAEFARHMQAMPMYCPNDEWHFDEQEDWYPIWCAVTALREPNALTDLADICACEDALTASIKAVLAEEVERRERVMHGKMTKLLGRRESLRRDMTSVNTQIWELHRQQASRPIPLEQPQDA